MTRASFLWLGLAVLCGTMLYITSQRVTDGLEHLAAVQKELRQEEESQRVLMAEWSYLNKPERLEKLSRTHLQMTPLRARQFIAIDKIDSLTAIAPAAGTTVVPITKPNPAPVTQTVQTTSSTRQTQKPQAQKPQAQKPQVQESVKPLAARGFNDVIQSLQPSGVKDQP